MRASEAWAECVAYLEAHCANPEGSVYPDGAMRYAMLLWTLCESIAAKTIIEVGIGLTSMSGVTFVHSLGWRGGGSLLSIDIDPQKPQLQYQELANDKGVNWQRIYGDSLAVTLPTDLMADVVYVDGDHDDEHALTDSRLLWRHLRPGGYLLIDDYPGNEGVVNAGTQLASEGLSFLFMPHDPPAKNGRLVCQKRMP